MERNHITHKGIDYPTILIPINLVDPEYNDSGADSAIEIADIELWNAIEEGYDNDVPEAVEIGNSIYYYCDSGFVDCNPTENQVIEYFERVNNY